MAICKLEGRLTVDTAWTMAVTEVGGGSATVTVLAAGDYYWTSATAALSAIATALTSNGTLSGTYSCTLDDDSDTSTGKVTLSATGVTSFAFTYPAGSPAPATTLGLAAQGAGAALTYTGASQAQYLWLPNCHRSRADGADGDDGIEETDGSWTLSPSGSIKALYYQTRYRDVLEFTALKASKVLKTYESTTNESLQQFYRDVIRHGRPLRYHKDRATDATYVTWRAEAMAEFRPQRLNPHWDNANSLMSWSSAVRKHV